MGYACACEEGGMVMGFARGTYPLTPFLRGRGNGERVCERMAMGFARDLSDGGIGLARDLRERVFGIHGIIHSFKAIKVARGKTIKKPCAPPFLVGTGVAYNERSE